MILEIMFRDIGKKVCKYSGMIKGDSNRNPSLIMVSHELLTILDKYEHTSKSFVITLFHQKLYPYHPVRFQDNVL